MAEAEFEAMRKAWQGARFRVGRSVGRTLYIQDGRVPSKDDRLIGLLSRAVPARVAR